MYRIDQLAGYDRSTILFSPDGRIIQVEYARKAMNRGSPSIGAKGKNCAVLAGRRKKDALVLPNKKVFSIDDHVGAIFSGYSADGRALVNYARERAQIYRFIYDEKVDIIYLTQEISTLMHTYTQFGGARPFGCGIIFGGVDNVGPQLVYLDPGGTMMEWIAGAIGINKDKAEVYLREIYKDKGLDMDFNEVLITALTALLIASEEKVEPIEVEVGYAKVGEDFVIKTGEDEEIKQFLEEAYKRYDEWVKKSESE
ncbi:MAG: archaeal proteasome endopeptidase complex subunit alpha [Candidatus Njordarchaeia archaeon]